MVATKSRNRRGHSKARVATPSALRHTCRAFRELTKAIAIPGNDRDPFMHYLLAVTFDRMGNQEKAMPLYQKAYDLATAHNPPAAYVRPLARNKLGITSPSRSRF